MIGKLTSDTGMMHANSRDLNEFKRWIYFMFAIFFVLALVSRLLPQSLRPFKSGASTPQSVYQEAMQAAHNVVPFLFMH